MNSLDRAVLVKEQFPWPLLHSHLEEFLNYHPWQSPCLALCEKYRRLTLMTLNLVAFLPSLAVSLLCWHPSLYCLASLLFLPCPFWNLCPWTSNIIRHHSTPVALRVAALTTPGVLGRVIAFQRGPHPNPWSLWVWWVTWQWGIKVGIIRPLSSWPQYGGE